MVKQLEAANARADKLAIALEQSERMRELERRERELERKQFEAELARRDQLYTHNVLLAALL